MLVAAVARKTKNELAIAYVNSQIQVAHTLKVEGKYEAALKKLRAIDELNVGIAQPLQDSVGKLTQQWVELQKLIEQANAANEALDYLKVIELYQQAQGIAYDERVAGLRYGRWFICLLSNKLFKVGYFAGT